MLDRSETIHDVLTARKSVRAYLDRAVPHAVLERVLATAARAPSGNNNQPWIVSVVTGAAKERLSSAIARTRHGDQVEPLPEYDYYPQEWPEPHLSRRRALGWALYDLIGIKRGEREKAEAHHNRNLRFFDAPVGLIFSVDRRLGAGAYVDIGLFMQTLAIAGLAEGLSSCMQAAFAPYHAVIREQLGLDDNLKVVCGMSLGYEDTSATINALKPSREPLSAFVTFHDR